jgi:hypothetical protein
MTFCCGAQSDPNSAASEPVSAVSEQVWTLKLLQISFQAYKTKYSTTITMPPHSKIDTYPDEGNSPTSPLERTQKRKKSIRLRLEKNEVFHIPHIDDFEQDVIQAVWYQQDEYAAMKVGLVSTIKKMMRGEEIPENNQSTVRGLEFRTRKGALRRQHNKLTAITAVLDEQDRQFSEGIFDEVLLSETYMGCSHHCMNLSHSIGKRDTEAIKEYMAEDTEPHVTVQPTGEIMRFRRNNGTVVEPVVEPSKKMEQKQVSFQKMFKQSRIRRRAMMDDSIKVQEQQGMQSQQPRVAEPTAA